MNEEQPLIEIKAGRYQISVPYTIEMEDSEIVFGYIKIELGGKV